MKIEPDELEYLFMSGITCLIGLNVEEEITAIYRRFFGKPFYALRPSIRWM
ncbi:hypothetical protein [Mesotoga sp.]|uniref:hypothetical protein n=1 Tax=Mesotoga sp. TaxID=2053577 RepID=UPI00345EAB3D